MTSFLLFWPKHSKRNPKSRSGRKSTKTCVERVFWSGFKDVLKVFKKFKTLKFFKIFKIILASKLVVFFFSFIEDIIIIIVVDHTLLQNVVNVLGVNTGIWKYMQKLIIIFSLLYYRTLHVRSINTESFATPVRTWAGIFYLRK